MLRDRAKKTLLKRAKRGFAGYPVATVAFYGPTDKVATKLVVGILEDADSEPEVMRKWSSESEIREDRSVLEEVLDFIREHQAKSVAMAGHIIGCPHEEGVDYPEGGSCPKCPFWAGRVRIPLQRDRQFRPIVTAHSGRT